MIGETFTLRSATTPWATLPMNTAGDVVCTKVNQDNYGAEYRFTGALGRYTVKVRNTVEPATAARPYAYNRHNIEVVYEQFADEGSGIPARVFISYMIHRHPVDEDNDTKKAIWYAGMFSAVEATVDKVLNFES